MRAQVPEATADTGEALFSVKVSGGRHSHRREFWAILSLADRTTLATGKGCNTRPPGATNYPNVTTLRDFLRKGAEHPYRTTLVGGRQVPDPQGVSCWGGYIRDGYLWAQQVMRQSPNAFTGSTQLGTYVDGVRQAQLDQDRDAQARFEAYVARPTWPPTNREESMYYGAWLAGECFEAQGRDNTFDKAGKIYVARWADKEGLNRARSARSGTSSRPSRRICAPTCQQVSRMSSTTASTAG